MYTTCNYSLTQLINNGVLDYILLLYLIIG
jgi:hypothetical protein